MIYTQHAGRARQYAKRSRLLYAILYFAICKHGVYIHWPYYVSASQQYRTSKFDLGYLHVFVLIFDFIFPS